MRSLRTILASAVILSFAAVTVPLQVSAQDPEAIVKQRQEAMKELGGHMKAINAFVESGTGSAADVAARAGAIQDTSTKITDLFPAGTSLDDGIGKTGAKPVIWADWDGFQSAASKLGELAGELKLAAAGGDSAAIGTQFAALGKNGCGGCHQTFRQKLD